MASLFFPTLFQLNPGKINIGFRFSSLGNSKENKVPFLENKTQWLSSYKYQINKFVSTLNNFMARAHIYLVFILKSYIHTK